MSKALLRAIGRAPPALHSVGAGVSSLQKGGYVPGIRAKTHSFVSQHRAMQPERPKATGEPSAPKPEARQARARKPSAKVWGYDAPTIVVHNHVPRPRCCHARKRRKASPLAPKAPDAPEVPLTGYRGVAQRAMRRAKRVGLFLLQAAMLVSSLMPRVSVGIGINPVWPDTWPSFMRRR